MKNILILLLFAILICNGCKDEPTPPEQLPEGYQQDIPWPSLADSPWPIYHADAQNTGRSKFTGPLSGKIITIINAKSMQSTPVLGPNNTLYFETADPTTLQCIRNYTEIIWKKEIGGSDFTSPVVDSENNVYFLTFSDLRKYDSQGELIWSYSLPVSNPLSASITLDRNGNVYYISQDKKVNAITNLVSYFIVFLNRD